MYFMQSYTLYNKVLNGVCASDFKTHYPTNTVPFFVHATDACLIQFNSIHLYLYGAKSQ